MLRIVWKILYVFIGYVWGFIKNTPVLKDIIKDIIFKQDFNNLYDKLSTVNINGLSFIVWMIVSTFVFWLGLAIWELYKGYEIALGSGIVFFSNNLDDSDKIHNKNYLLQKLELSNTTSILGATGVKTFVEPDTPIFDAIKNKNCSFRILLAMPDSFAVKERCRRLPFSEVDYNNEIFKSINYLSSVYRTNMNIKLKLYSQPAIWKMIFAGDFLWLQYYGDKHVDHSNIYGISKSLRSNIYEGLHSVWLKRWEIDGNPEVDLRSISSGGKEIKTIEELHKHIMAH